MKLRPFQWRTLLESCLDNTRGGKRRWTLLTCLHGSPHVPSGHPTTPPSPSILSSPWSRLVGQTWQHSVASSHRVGFRQLCCPTSVCAWKTKEDPWTGWLESGETALLPRSPASIDVSPLGQLSPALASVGQHRPDVSSAAMHVDSLEERTHRPNQLGRPVARLLLGKRPCTPPLTMGARKQRGGSDASKRTKGRRPTTAVVIQ